MSNTPPPPPPPSNFGGLPLPPPPPVLSRAGPPPPPPMSSTMPTKPATKWQSHKTEEQPQKKKSGTRKAFNFYTPDVHAEYFDARSSPNRIKWDKIRSCFLSSNPTAGVFFVETQIEDEYVVIKGTSTICQEVFGSSIAQKMGLNAPHVTVLEYSPNPYHSEWRYTKTALGNKMNSQDPVFTRRADKELNRAFFILMEFVPNAISMEDIADSPDVMKLVLSDRQILADLGKMVICDVILNNWDRIPIPMLWAHEGNAGNVLFSASANPTKDSPNRLTLIDQMISRILESNIPKYLANVQNFLADLYTHKQNASESEVVNSICKFCTDYTLYDQFSELDKQSIMDGLLEGLEVVKKWEKGDLQQWKDQVDAMKTGSDWADVWLEGMKSIDVDFISQVVQTIREYTL